MEKEDAIESKKDHSHCICKGRDIEMKKEHHNWLKKSDYSCNNNDHYYQSEKRPPEFQ